VLEILRYEKVYQRLDGSYWYRVRVAVDETPTEEFLIPASDMEAVPEEKLTMFLERQGRSLMNSRTLQAA
jgi:hypothetical protein